MFLIATVLGILFSIWFNSFTNLPLWRNFKGHVWNGSITEKCYWWYWIYLGSFFSVLCKLSSKSSTWNLSMTYFLIFINLKIKRKSLDVFITVRHLNSNLFWYFSGESFDIVLTMNIYFFLCETSNSVIQNI